MWPISPVMFWQATLIRPWLPGRDRLRRIGRTARDAGVAAILAAGLTGLVAGIAAIAIYAGDGALVALGQALSASVGLAAFSLPVWLAGIVLLGLPARALLGPGLGRAALAGAGLPTLAVALPVALGAGAEVLASALWLAPVGTTAALFFERRSRVGAASEHASAIEASTTRDGDASGPSCHVDGAGAQGRATFSVQPARQRSP